MDISPTPIVEETTATGEEINAIIARLEPALWNQRRSHVIIAMLSLALSLQNPELTAEELQEGVRGVSQWIALFLTGKDTEDSKVTLN